VKKSSKFTQEEISKAYDVVIDIADTIGIQWLSKRKDLSVSQLEAICLKRMNGSTASRLLEKVGSEQALKNLLNNPSLPNYSELTKNLTIIQNTKLPLEFRKTFVSLSFLKLVSKARSVLYLEKHLPKDIWPYIKDQLMIKDIIE
jgi:hypothetical protein